MAELPFHYFRESDFDKALCCLGGGIEHSLYRSLLYRYLNRWTSEAEVLADMARRGLATPYLQARTADLARPAFQLMAPRRLEGKAPGRPQNRAAGGRRLCFISGADSNYFELLYECIESIRRSATFRDVPFNIIDAGLTSEQRSAINPLLCGGRTLDPGWPFSFRSFLTLDKKRDAIVATDPSALPGRYKVIVAKGALDLLFPGFDYYFWINPNSWVQDQNALVSYLAICAEQGLAFPDASHGKARPLGQVGGIRTTLIPEKYRALAFSQRHGCDAVFCAKAEVLGSLREILLDLVALNDGAFFYYFFEFAQSILRAERALCKDPPIHFYAHMSYKAAPQVGYKPLIKATDPDTIYSQHAPNQPVGIIRPVSLDSYEDELFVQNDANEIVGRMIGSTRYRTFPAGEKIWLRQYLSGLRDITELT